MAHFWEVPGFAIQHNPDEEAQHTQISFQEDVLHYIKNGVSTILEDGETPLAGPRLGDHQEQLQDADVFIFSVAEVATPNDLTYEDEIEQTREALDEAIGKGKADFHIRPYVRPANDADVLPILLEYDPEPRMVRLLLYNHDILFESYPELYD
ncbi:hypothetical protein BDV95DRAFT_607901 [Massariosphaeria phaeospora]|uniref:Uncharacterized protein n=1 Tax=Massariosphaeria phaeospora TaxID=100035 RepID=A0A7C8I4P3_9PLEO|nr:hypothetical protein BDV95DRAFT_607901 [Massariosphaeria phaeospora]